MFRPKTREVYEVVGSHACVKMKKGNKIKAIEGKEEAKWFLFKKEGKKATMVYEIDNCPFCGTDLPEIE